MIRIYRWFTSSWPHAESPTGVPAPLEAIALRTLGLRLTALIAHGSIRE
ncbi:MAG: hypothetical protein ACLP0L_16490 [Solirubrobacteraceae bacterium]